MTVVAASTCQLPCRECIIGGKQMDASWEWC